MTSHCRSQSAGDVSPRDKEFPAQPVGAFYDDSLRPKSFLHDEVDEFNRVLAELLQSKQRSQPVADEEDDLMRCSENRKDDAFQTTQRDRRDGVYDCERQTTTDTWLDSQPARVTDLTDDDSCTDDDGETVVIDDDDDDHELEIVEDEDEAKHCSSHLPVNMFTDDLLNEVSQ